MTPQTSESCGSGSPEEFVYDVIDHSNREMRLLELLAATLPHEPIICHLHSQKLDAPESYEALSYVWGDSRIKFPIQVNGKQIPVTHNLNTALRHLRQTDSNRTLWIDALCINQEDQKEKESQLGIMSEIFERAERVIAWLGPAADDSDEVMTIFNEKGGKSANIKSKKALKIGEFLMEPSRNRLRRALVAIMERDFWTRVWVVQEIVQARKIVLVCGQSSAEWNGATTIIRVFLKARRDVLDKSSPRRGGSRSGMTWSMKVQRLMTLEHLSDYKLSDANERGPDWLLKILMQLRHFKSTIQQDKIFGFLGLLNPELFQSTPDIPALFEINYDWSFREVSLRVFKNCSLTHGSLNIVCASQPDYAEAEFPSWLPDFSRDSGMVPWPFITHHLECFLAADAIIPDNDTLILTACRLRQIQPTHLTGPDDDYLATDDLGLLTRLGNFLQVARKVGGISRHFWVTVLLGATVSQDMSVITDEWSDQDVLEWLGEGLKNNRSLAKSFFDLFRRYSYLRRFAVVEHLVNPARYEPVLVPASTKPGDYLYALGGCNFPVILRSQGTHFRFVGPCFIVELWPSNRSGFRLNLKECREFWGKYQREATRITLK